MPSSRILYIMPFLRILYIMPFSRILYILLFPHLIVFAWSNDWCKINYILDNLIYSDGSLLPAYLPTYLPACLPAYLPAYLPTYLPTYLPACLPACLPTYLSVCPSVYAYLSVPTCLCHLDSIDRIVYRVRWLVVRTVVVWLWRRSCGDDGRLAPATAV